MQNKVIFLGESGVGKTSLIAKIIGIQKKINRKTVGVDNWIVYHKNRAYIIADTEGSLDFYQKSSGFFLESDIAVVFTREKEPSDTEKEMAKIYLSTCKDSKLIYVQMSSTDEIHILDLIHETLNQ